MRKDELEAAEAARRAVLQAVGHVQSLYSRHELRTGHTVSRETSECGLLDFADAAISVLSLISYALQGVIDEITSQG